MASSFLSFVNSNPVTKPDIQFATNDFAYATFICSFYKNQEKPFNTAILQNANYLFINRFEEYHSIVKTVVQFLTLPHLNYMLAKRYKTISDLKTAFEYVVPLGVLTTQPDEIDMLKKNTAVNVILQGNVDNVFNLWTNSLHPLCKVGFSVKEVKSDGAPLQFNLTLESNRLEVVIPAGQTYIQVIPELAINVDNNKEWKTEYFIPIGVLESSMKSKPNITNDSRFINTSRKTNMFLG